MEWRQLRYFVAVAEEGSVKRAAERVGLSQPHLSRQLALLEQGLGVTLLPRSPHGTDLTEAGRVFLVRARRLLERQDLAVRELQPYREAQDDRLRLGVPDADHVAPVFESVVRTFQEAWPGVTLRRVGVPWIRHAAEVRAGRLDVGFGCSVTPDDYRPDVMSARIVDDPCGHALLGEHHGLARRADLGPADLRHLPLFVPPAQDLPALRGHQLGALRGAGFDPPLAPRPGSFREASQAVADGSGWMLTSRLVARRPPPGTVAVPLRGVELCTGYDVLWREGDLRLSVNALVEVCRAAFSPVAEGR